MKIYTKKGDQGQTSLLSGERVSKTHPCINVLGDIDELNSFLGAINSSMNYEDDYLKQEIFQIQSNLFEISALISKNSESNLINDYEKFLFELEKSIDKMENQLPELKKFILPGGHMVSSMAHIARSVCRRAERNFIKILEQNQKNKSCSSIISSYLNRLSDYLFVFARYYNHIYFDKDEILLI